MRLQMTELLDQVQKTADLLKARSFNPISLSAGANLLLRFVTLQRPSLSQSFDGYKRELAQEARAFVKGSKMCAKKIIHEASMFVQDGSVIITHSYVSLSSMGISLTSQYICSYSRLVAQTLIHAATVSRKRFSVYVTEARPFGLGLKTHAVLTKAGIPCTVILDSAVAYTMGKCDMVVCHLFRPVLSSRLLTSTVFR